ncbi:MAG: glycoside hydrolase family 92 protein, partial [Lysobacteraceae bacterium]
RGRNWRRVWDADVVDAPSGFRGFPRPRVEGGAFYLPMHGGYDPRSNHGFHEGTAWQYQWLAQQDVAGLAAAMGGRAATLLRLDAFFAHDELAKDIDGGARKYWVVGPYSYYNQFRYNPNNEPDLHSPWMYTLLGQPWKTTTVVRAAQALFSDAPDGVTGNDDLGTMSAWYVFSALGLYPAVPGTGQLLLHAPRFPRAQLDLGHGRMLTLEAPGADAAGPHYVEAVRVDGRPHPGVAIDWSNLRDGGTLHFQLASQPDPRGWGTHPLDLPASPCPAH